MLAMYLPTQAALHAKRLGTLRNVQIEIYFINTTAVIKGKVRSRTAHENPEGE
jgi:hypothetical protein